MTQADVVLCACGSGLSTTSCCSLPNLSNAELDVQNKPPSVSASNASAVGDDRLAVEAQHAAEALRAGDRTTAERLSLSVLERAPRLPLALATLAEIHFVAARHRAAKALLERLSKLEPANLWPINKLAMVALGLDDMNGAEQHARQAVRLAPTNMQAHNLMGMAMTQGHRPVIGEYHCRKALELAGRPIPLVLSNLATCLKEQGRIAEARELYRQAVDLEPNSRATLLAWAQMEEADRQFDAVNAVLDRLERLGPLGSAATLVRAAVLSRTKRYQEAMALLNGQARALRPVEQLERGRLLDQVGCYDEAWADFSGAKARLIELTEQKYERQKAQDMARELKTFFTRERLALLPRAEVRTDIAQPVFILGFPRSGTTLLEQTLTVAPEIAAGDELVLVNEIAELAPRLLNSPWDYPGALAELWLGDRREGLDTLRDHYLQRVRQLGVLRDGARLFTDKMPLNEVHLGLIGLMFPQAPLLHLIRHPLDIMVSAMSNLFTHGLYCGHALETAAEHLVLAHDLVAHYRAEMKLRYLAVRYEDFVDAQEATVRGVFNFIGMPFDAAVLSQEVNPRFARTASYAQVTEKLYARSRYRYRHYLRHLEPVLTTLEPLILRLGYEIEAG